MHNCTSPYCEECLGGYRKKPNECTCPSGDGSLMWPCPTHPPEYLMTAKELQTKGPQKMTDDSLQRVIDEMELYSRYAAVPSEKVHGWREILAALSAQTEARDDTARIDYLETLRGDMITGTSDDQELIGHDWVIYGQFYTVREALDYGMMKRQEAIDKAIAQGDL